MKKFLLLIISIELVNLKANSIDEQAKIHKILENYSPNFEIALGSQCNYFGRFYYDCIKNLHSRKSHWGALQINPNPLYKFVEFCKNLYQANQMLKTEIKEVPKIPLIVHQIWLGSPFPEKYKYWQKTWQLAGWEYKLWTDADVNNMETFVNRDLYLSSKNYGQRSDILRLEILNQHGGLYIDIDFECLNPTIFTMLNHMYDLYTGLHPLDCKVFGIANGLIGAAPNHPVLQACIEELRKQKRANNYREIVINSGPGLFTNMCWKKCGKNTHDIIFPPTFFYPLGQHQHKTMKSVSADNLKKVVCKAETIAIHWWEGSWFKPGSGVTASN